MSMFNLILPSEPKRIIVGCDGTWVNSDTNCANSHSNIPRMLDAMSSHGYDGHGIPIHQTKYYQGGIGTGTATWLDKNVGNLLTGITGLGIIQNITQVYAHICRNWANGDEIILIGFSRGAYTVRCVASLIDELGLLNTQGLKYLDAIIDDWVYQDSVRQRPETSFDRFWPDRPAFKTQRYQDTMEKHGLTRRNVSVNAVAVFDTVGSLGIPYKHKLGLLRNDPRDLEFIDTYVPSIVRHAFHAMALDERRSLFAPTVWQRGRGSAKDLVLKQTWFPGVHSDIGGNYKPLDLGALSLSWMVGQLAHHNIVTFNDSLSMSLVQDIADSDADSTQSDSAQTWGLGYLHDSEKIHQGLHLFRSVRSWLYRRAFGTQTRSPGMCTATEKRGTTYVKTLAQDTEEFIHSSVRVRYNKHGRGYDGKGDYKPSALLDHGWQLERLSEGSQDNHEFPRMRWVYKDVQPATKLGAPIEMILEEDTLTKFEQQVFNQWYSGRARSVVEPGKSNVLQQTNHLHIDR